MSVFIGLRYTIHVSPVDLGSISIPYCNILDQVNRILLRPIDCCVIHGVIGDACVYLGSMSVKRSFEAELDNTAIDSLYGMKIPISRWRTSFTMSSITRDEKA